MPVSAVNEPLNGLPTEVVPVIVFDISELLNRAIVLYLSAYVFSEFS